MEPTYQEFKKQFKELSFDDECYRYAHYWITVSPNAGFGNMLPAFTTSDLSVQETVKNWGLSGIYTYPKEMLIIWNKKKL